MGQKGGFLDRMSFLFHEDAMCGRYRLSRRKQLIAEYFDTMDEVDWEPRYNIAPTQNVGIVRQGRERPIRKFSLARWGLIPYWAKNRVLVRR